MKKLNIAACIIVLLLAIVSAVFSYFLYEKRMQFVQGWDQMSQAIQKSATTIDKVIDPSAKAASKLTAGDNGTLSHKTYEQTQMDATLKNLQNQSSKLVEQYTKKEKGWEVLVTKINEASKKIDEVGDNKYAKKLTADTLKFNKLAFDEAEFTKQAEELVKQSKDIVTQYNNAMTGWNVLVTKINRASAIIDNQDVNNTNKYASALGKDDLKFEGLKFNKKALEDKADKLVQQATNFSKNSMAGWNILTDKIAKASKKIDEIGDEKFADALTADELKFNASEFNVAAFEEKADKLVTQSEKIVEQYTNAMTGWEIMAEKIDETAKILDEQSDDKYALGLTADTELKFHGLNFDKNSFDGKAGKLVEQSRRFVNKYNNAIKAYDALIAKVNRSSYLIDQQTGGNEADNLTESVLGFNNRNFDLAAYEAKFQVLVDQVEKFANLYADTKNGWQLMSKTLVDNTKKLDGITVNKYTQALEKTKFADNTDFNEENFRESMGLVNAQVNEIINLYMNAEKGWKLMETTLVANARILDQVSRNKVSGRIDKYAFNSKNFNQKALENQLALLTAQNNEVVAMYNNKVKELNAMTARYNNEVAAHNETKRDLTNMTTHRNTLAAALASIGSYVHAQNCDKQADFTGGAYQSRINIVVPTVEGIYLNRDAIANELVRIASIDKVKIDKARMLKVDYRNPKNVSEVKTAVKPISDIIETQRAARKSFSNALSDISGKLGVAFQDDYNKAHSNPNAIVVASNNKVAEAERLSENLVKAGEEKRVDEATIKRHEATIAKHEATIAEYEKTIGLDEIGGDVVVKNWDRGSINARMITSGTVTKVSQEYGYIVVDLGTETTVLQKIGTREIPVNPDLEAGLDFNVVRDGKFIATIKLNNVGKKESTADIPPQKANMIQVGDKVVFKK